MSNIDKDIEIIKGTVKVHNDFLKGCDNQIISEKEIKALENVLSELEKKENIIKLMSMAISSYDSNLVINEFKNKEEVKQFYEENYEELIRQYGEQFR